MSDRYSTEVSEIWSKRGQYFRLLQASRPAAFMSGGPLLANLVGEVVDLMAANSEVHFPHWQGLEARYDHDIAAFVELVREELPETWDDGSGNPRQEWHLDRTSSDLVETALGIGLDQTHDLLLDAHRRLVNRLSMFAWSWRDAPVMGRTHGQWAEPTSVGRKFAVFAYGLEFAVPARYGVGKVSGPVGTDVVMEDVALQAVDLKPVPSTQVVPRWYLARYMAEVMAYSVVLSSIATEIRLASQTGGWLHEGRVTREARGSSAMPQKRNPIRSERVVGLCKVVRHSCHAVIDAGAELWNERDISHSSVERLAMVQALELTNFIQIELARVVDGLELDREVAALGTELDTGVGTLTAAVTRGVDREVAYQVIRSLGPKEAAEKLDVDGRGRAYAPDVEPELWRFVSDRAHDRA